MIDLTKRLGFSEELLRDCGPGNPPAYQSWLQKKLRTTVPPGEFWFFVNPGTEQTTADSIKQQLGATGKGLTVRVLARPETGA